MKTSRILIAAVVCFMLLPGSSAIACLRGPLPEALEALDSSFSVEVATVTVAFWDNSTPAPDNDDIYYLFTPKRSEPKIGFIILPGGNCDPRSYAPAAHEIAEEGFLTCIIPVPSCIAIPGYERANRVIQDHKEIATWVIGGHSVGGTAAGVYAFESGAVSGVVIWASLPDPAHRLDNSTTKVLCVYGSEDGRATPELVMEYKQYLPADTEYVEIRGGNHTQFGWIDTSPDAYLSSDNPATISIERQQREIVRATADFLEEFEEHSCPVVSLFGSQDPRTKTIARFRDEVLAKSAAGRSIIASYKKNGAKAVALFEKYPFMKSAAGKLLQALVPALEFLL